jgi:type III secretory pathway lipoprotein EscJ
MTEPRSQALCVQDPTAEEHVEVRSARCNVNRHRQNEERERQHVLSFSIFIVHELSPDAHVEISVPDRLRLVVFLLSLLGLLSVLLQESHVSGLGL